MKGSSLVPSRLALGRTPVSSRPFKLHVHQSICGSGLAISLVSVFGVRKLLNGEGAWVLEVHFHRDIDGRAEAFRLPLWI